MFSVKQVGKTLVTRSAGTKVYPVANANLEASRRVSDAARRVESTRARGYTPHATAGAAARVAALASVALRRANPDSRAADGRRDASPAEAAMPPARAISTAVADASIPAHLAARRRRSQGPHLECSLADLNQVRNRHPRARWLKTLWPAAMMSIVFPPRSIGDDPPPPPASTRPRARPTPIVERSLTVILVPAPSPLAARINRTRTRLSARCSSSARTCRGATC